MTPAQRFWEKRYLLWKFGSYHQNVVAEDLKTLEWAIKRHQDIDREEAQKAR